MKKPGAILTRLGPRLFPVLAAVLSLLAGMALALMLDYLLYRVGLPGRPFIYVSF
jgi:hypothetical protein